MNNIDDLEIGKPVAISFLLTRIIEREKRDNSTFYELHFQDKTGRIEGRLWDHSSVPANEGDIVRVEGKVVEYKSNPQIKISKITEDRNADVTKYVQTTDRDPEGYFEDVASIVDQRVEHPQIRVLLEEYLGLNFGGNGTWEVTDCKKKKALISYPAARGKHHALVGGLMQHICSMLKASVDIVDHYNEMYDGEVLDIDKVIAGVILHDYSKIDELISPINSSHTEEGQKSGHIVLGIERLNEYKIKSGLDEEIYSDLKHIIASHHGRKEWGSPKEPQTAEAELVHKIDMLDSRMDPLCKERE